MKIASAPDLERPLDPFPEPMLFRKSAFVVAVVVEPAVRAFAKGLWSLSHLLPLPPARVLADVYKFSMLSFPTFEIYIVLKFLSVVIYSTLVLGFR